MMTSKLRTLFQRSVRLTGLAAAGVALAAIALLPGVHAGGPDNVISLCEGDALFNDCDGADIRFQTSTTSGERNFGFSVAVGHLNNDGLKDIAVGSPVAGQVYIFFGRPEFSVNPDSDVRQISGNAADLILSSTASDFGFSVAIAPIASGQSSPLLVGAPALSDDTQAGQLFIIPNGTLTSGSVTITGGNSTIVTGEAAGDQFGYAVSSGAIFAGGARDIAVSARNAAAGAGRVYAIREPAGAVNLTDSINVKFLDGGAGEGLGESLVIADFAGAGQVAAGAVGIDPTEGDPGEGIDPNPTGRVYFVNFTDAGQFPDGGAFAPAPLCILGEQDNDFFGFSMAAGDFVEGAATDIAVGAIFSDRVAPALTNSGAVYVIPDVAGQGFSTTCAVAGTQQKIDGYRQWDQLGFAMATGEFDGMSKADLVFTSRLNDRDQTEFNEIDQGAAYVYFGGGNLGSLPTSTDCTVDATECHVSAPALVNRMIAGGLYQNTSIGDPNGSRSDEMGFAIATGDVNQDGVFDDMVITSITHGRAYLVTLEDTDGDDLRDIRDRDDDNDGVADSIDLDPLDPFVCGDSDNDLCDDCQIGVDQFGPQSDQTPDNDGVDTDSDGICDDGDPDDDNDGVLDGDDNNSLNPDLCRDLDGDGCDDCECFDCTSNDDGFGPNPDFDVSDDGLDTDSDGECNLGDTDDDNDGVADGPDPDPLDPNVCGTDAEGDGCDDCAIGVDGFGPLPDNDPDNDGTDADSDQWCDVGDCDDADPNNWTSCATCLDTDADTFFAGCDDYVTITGPDCDPANPNCEADCTDADSDTYCVNNDCSDSDPNNFASCGTCADGDSDMFFAGCDVYSTIMGPDCNDAAGDTFPGAAPNDVPPGECRKDSDGDDYGDISPPAGVTPGTDCDDTDPGASPGSIWFTDGDTDGFGDPGSGVAACVQPPGTVAVGGDCDDSDGNTFPGSAENEVNAADCMTDADNDGYGDDTPAAGVTPGTDCDDGVTVINPETPWFADLDMDLFGDPGNSTMSCTQPAGFLSDNTDPDDADPCVPDGDALSCPTGDTDGDDVPNGFELAEGTDPDNAASFIDSDSDGTPDFSETDADNDGTSNTVESGGTDPYGDADADNVPNYLDADDRGDGSAAACTDAGLDGICDSGSALDPLHDADQDGTAEFQDPLALTSDLEPSFTEIDSELLRWTDSGADVQYHLYRGDLATLASTGVYTQDEATVDGAAQFCWLTDTSFADGDAPQPGQTLFYLVTGDNGAEGSLGQVGDGTSRAQTNSCR